MKERFVVPEKEKQVHDSYYMEVCEPKLKALHQRIDGIHLRLLLGVAAIVMTVGFSAWGLGYRFSGMDSLKETVQDNNGKLKDIGDRQIEVIKTLSRVVGKLFPEYPLQAPQK